MIEIEDFEYVRFVLVLNPITAPKSMKIAVAYSDSVDKLKAFVESEKVPTYEDAMPNPLNGEKNWMFFKVFRKGGPLENFNGPDEKSYMPVPTLEQTLRREEVHYLNWLEGLKFIE